MKFSLLILFSLVLSFIAISQNYIGSEKQELLEIYTNYQGLYKNDSTTFTVDLVDLGSELKIHITGNDDLQISYFFIPDGNFEDRFVCDSIFIQLLCTTCVEHNINNMLGKKHKRWIMISSDQYISKHSIKTNKRENGKTMFQFPVMKISRLNGTATVIIHLRETANKKWRKL